MAKATKKAPPTKPAKKLAIKKIARKPAKKRSRAQPITGPTLNDTSSAVLNRLWNVVLARRDADPAMSHSARLISRGTAKVAQKFGEEAVECLIEAVAGNRAALIEESADVLYHLIVLWVNANVAPTEVWSTLERREGMSGIAEKAARETAETRKIP